MNERYQKILSESHKSPNEGNFEEKKIRPPIAILFGRTTKRDRSERETDVSRMIERV